MDRGIIEVLKKIKNDYGDSIFENKNRVTSLISDYAGGQYKGEINLLNITLSLGLLNEIKSAPSEYSNIRNRYIMRLITEYFLTEDQAIFAVDVWGIIAGIINELESKIGSKKSQTQNDTSEYFSHSETRIKKDDGSYEKSGKNYFDVKRNYNNVKNKNKVELATYDASLFKSESYAQQKIKTYKLIIIRKNQFYVWNPIVGININTTKLLSVENGGTCSIDLPEGHDRIEISWSFRKTILEFEMHNDVTLILYGNRLTGKMEVEVQGATVLYLEKK